MVACLKSHLNAVKAFFIRVDLFDFVDRSCFPRQMQGSTKSHELKTEIRYRLYVFVRFSGLNVC